MRHRLVGAVIIAVVFSVQQESELLRRSVMVGAYLQETGASTGATAAGDQADQGRARNDGKMEGWTTRMRSISCEYAARLSKRAQRKHRAEVDGRVREVAGLCTAAANGRQGDDGLREARAHSPCAAL